VAAEKRFPISLGMEWVQYMLLLAAEAAWSYPWSIAVGHWFGAGAAALSLPMLVLLLTVSLLATRLITGLVRRLWLGQVLLVVLACLVVSVTAVAELPALREGVLWEEGWYQMFNTGFGARAALAGVFAGFLWRRGALFGRSLPTSFSIEEQFRTGMVALTSLLMVSSLAGEYAPVSGDPLVLSTLLFVSASLIGMPLAQVAEVSRSSRYRDGSGLAPSAQWIGMLLGVLMGVLAATLLLADLLTFERASRVWEAVRDPLGAVLYAVVQIVAIPIGLLVEALIFLMRLLIRPGSQQPRPRQDALPGLDQIPEGELASLSPEMLLVLKLVAVIGLGLLFLWLLIRAISRLNRGWQRDGVEESRDFVWSWPHLGALWRWLLARLRPVAVTLRRVAEPRRSIVTVGGVRRQYTEFLSLGARMGRARRPSETPLEYERRLVADPALIGGEEVCAITASYLQARYAPPHPEGGDLGAAASALVRLRALWAKVHLS